MARGSLPMSSRCSYRTLSPGEIVLMDNLGSHKRVGVRKAIEAAGAAVCFLPAYSPDLDPIEQVFAKLKNTLRKMARRTVMHSGTQSELPSMTFPQKNASTIFAMPDMGPPNQDTIECPTDNRSELSTYAVGGRPGLIRRPNCFSSILLSSLW